MWNDNAARVTLRHIYLPSIILRHASPKPSQIYHRALKDTPCKTSTERKTTRIFTFYRHGKAYNRDTRYARRKLIIMEPSTEKSSCPISRSCESAFFFYTSSASFPTFMWGRCFLWDTSIELGLELPPLTVLSPTSHSLCYPTTSALVFLSFSFPRHLHHHHSLAYTHSSSLLNTYPYHFNLLSWTFWEISPTFVVSLILSFLILSSLVTPLINHKAGLRLSN